MDPDAFTPLSRRAGRPTDIQTGDGCWQRWERRPGVRENKDAANRRGSEKELWNENSELCIISEKKVWASFRLHHCSFTWGALSFCFPCYYSNCWQFHIRATCPADRRRATSRSIRLHAYTPKASWPVDQLFSREASRHLPTYAKTSSPQSPEHFQLCTHSFSIPCLHCALYIVHMSVHHMKWSRVLCNRKPNKSPSYLDSRDWLYKILLIFCDLLNHINSSALWSISTFPVSKRWWVSSLLFILLYLQCHSMSSKKGWHEVLKPICTTMLLAATL